FRATAVAGAAAVLEVAGGDRQGAAVGTAVPVPPSVRVLDGAGNPVAGVVVRFDVRSGGGWIVADSVQTDADGAARTIWYLGPSPGGPHALRADAGIGLTAELTAQAMPADPALTYFGRNDYIEYLPGTLPIIVSAAHGGHLLPDELPERSWGVTVRDTNTQELARQIAQAFVARTGRAPHIIISRLHRRKLDANRDIEEAAQGSFFAEWAWREFQGFIDVAKQAAAGAHGGGFYIDLHGHGHPNARLELGYLLRASELELSDSVLDAASWLAEESSIRTLAARSPLPFAELLRGEGSLGSGFERLGYPAVPSGPQPDPGGEPYFNGGYNTRRHGSMDGGPIDGVQIEAHYSDVRDTEASRAAFASALAEILEVFLAEHYDVDIAGARLPGR
ncbi:MAG TPA: Ig-like domain-containing protein, partial [Longimicrobiales bacterium]|nr:Ig-like domain-containing protein [Longimicrobiales bacterium]